MKFGAPATRFKLEVEDFRLLRDLINEKAGLHFGDEGLEAASEARLAQRARPFFAPFLPVLRREPPECGAPDHFNGVPDTEPRSGVGFTLEAHHRVRAGMDVAVDQPRKMDSQEWIPWIWNRIDQVPHLVVALIGKLIIVTPETDDLFFDHGAILSVVCAGSTFFVAAGRTL
jgi:hypothetical protein